MHFSEWTQCLFLTRKSNLDIKIKTVYYNNHKIICEKIIYQLNAIKFVQLQN
jgi:hypothetical protein